MELKGGRLVRFVQFNSFVVRFVQFNSFVVRYIQFNSFLCKIIPSLKVVCQTEPLIWTIRIFIRYLKMQFDLIKLISTWNLCWLKRNCFERKSKNPSWKMVGKWEEISATKNMICNFQAKYKVVLYWNIRDWSIE